MQLFMKIFLVVVDLLVLAFVLLLAVKASHLLACLLYIAISFWWIAFKLKQSFELLLNRR